MYKGVEKFDIKYFYQTCYCLVKDELYHKKMYFLANVSNFIKFVFRALEIQFTSIGPYMCQCILQNDW